MKQREYNAFMYMYFNGLMYFQAIHGNKLNSNDQLTSENCYYRLITCNSMLCQPVRVNFLSLTLRLCEALKTICCDTIHVVYVLCSLCCMATCLIKIFICAKDTEAQLDLQYVIYCSNSTIIINLYIN